MAATGPRSRMEANDVEVFEGFGGAMAADGSDHRHPARRCSGRGRVRRPAHAPTRIRHLDRRSRANQCLGARDVDGHRHRSSGGRCGRCAPLDRGGTSTRSSTRSTRRVSATSRSPTRPTRKRLSLSTASRPDARALRCSRTRTARSRASSRSVPSAARASPPGTWWLRARLTCRSPPSCRCRRRLQPTSRRSTSSSLRSTSRPAPLPPQHRFLVQRRSQWLRCRQVPRRCRRHPSQAPRSRRLLRHRSR